MSKVQRVALFGTESTGKTFLAERLAQYFDEPWSQEFVREFWEAQSGVIVASDLDAIARGQIANEEAAAADAQRVVFCDTDLLTCTLWNDLLFPGACPVWVRAEADQRAKNFALYLLCDTDVEFAADPQRCFPSVEARQHARHVWRDAVITRGLPFVEIRGDWTERERIAIKAVEALSSG
jgi:HTH-type transcriptional regulator, transcriptional repressor of NAD biosynthesis genes